MSTSSRHQSSYNLCNLPTRILGSHRFNEEPEPLELLGVRRDNRALFELLAAEPDPERRAELFSDYMTVKFALEEGAVPGKRGKPKRHDYLRLLRGWGVDSSSVEGAVLKGWVESRFGLYPTFHLQPLTDPDAPEWQRYAADRARGRVHDNATDAQLDVLYEFVQWELRARSHSHFTAFRGTHDAPEHDVLEPVDRRRTLVRLNNLSSFTLDKEVAWEFGSTVWKAAIPAPKVFCLADVLPKGVLRGEAELLVIGGEYLVEELR